MIKKLDLLILKAFSGPFIITFFIATFVLMMQILWKYLDDLVGKGLDFVTVMQFLWYASASLLTLAMPIAILISSIMTFGNLGESFELVAVKSSGISLLRFMRPLIIVAMLLSFVTFLFANYVIPYATLKFKTLYGDIYYKKPAFDLKEGIFFTHIPNYAIKVGKKDDDGKTIHDVIIFEQGGMVQDNSITAEKGTMTVSADKNFLEFNLENGYRYQERGNAFDSSTEFVRLKFRQFKKLFDLSVLQKRNTSDSNFRNSFQMLSAKQLNKRIDSLRKRNDSINHALYKDFDYQFHFRHQPDSLWKLASGSPPDSLVFPDSLLININNTAIAKATAIKNMQSNQLTEADNRWKDIRGHLVEFHRKFSLSLACFILFFIGAPLGSIIRKGGLGMPLVVAIIFFLMFHLLNVFGEKFVKENILPPYIGIWLAVIVLTPVGIFLTYKAMHDSQLFNKEFYYRLFKGIRNFRKHRETISSS
jgi:lipopolysaccharide export system permease protein